MLGRKTFEKSEIDHARAMADGQLNAFEAVVRAVQKSGDAKATAAVQALESVTFNNSALALDRCFVHRVRMVTGKDTSPLNELELIAESLMDHKGVFTGNTVIKYLPEQSVLGLKEGDRVELTAQQFGELTDAVLTEVRQKFR